MKKIKLVMFDLDGTLYDTSMSNFYSYEESIKKICGIDIDKDFFVNKCFGRNYKSFLPDLGVSEGDIKSVHDLKVELYDKYLDTITINENLIYIAKLLKQNGTKTAIVTTGSRINTEEILRHFGHYDLFDLLVTQDTVKAPKPSPDGYLYAMKHFGAEPDECIIFEDTDVGIESALPCKTGIMRIVHF